ncbi:hypothetical protein PRIPAC_90343 [Pristionchus pacificus]|uniref:Uncharacterized protein n=1 Tax=Pristionchus pacificus TaxID=54126 RepID=A0A2A6CY81_PRIPA|nr:hypothetical protein PRIPAC_90343 [Pristionchus pacificus]|eukprot:PDM83046.1 hypothetical protein PRIPAC_37439 [Pristionchus pacificus]
MVLFLVKTYWQAASIGEMEELERALIAQMDGQEKGVNENGLRGEDVHRAGLQYETFTSTKLFSNAITGHVKIIVFYSLVPRIIKENERIEKEKDTHRLQVASTMLSANSRRANTAAESKAAPSLCRKIKY